jgi:hypothetical protein
MTQLDAEIRAAASRRRGVAGGDSLEDDREQVRQLVTRKPLAVAPPTTPTSAAERRARVRLVAMLKARDKHGENSRVSVEDIARQRTLVANGDGEAHEHGRERITWLATPVALPGSGTIRVCGWAHGSRLPAWLSSILERGEAQEAA